MVESSGYLRRVCGGLFIPAVVVLLLQAAASRAFTINERELTVPALATLPMDFGGWRAPEEQSLDRDTTDYLKPDSYILRDYRSELGSGSINLFVAYFKSLKNVYGPHSPRVCLPG